PARKIGLCAEPADGIRGVLRSRVPRDERHGTARAAPAAGPCARVSLQRARHPRQATGRGTASRCACPGDCRGDHAPPGGRGELTPAEVLNLGDGHEGAARRVLGRYGLELRLVADGAPIPGSWWGEREAGLRGRALYARADTPLH